MSTPSKWKFSLYPPRIKPAGQRDFVLISRPVGKTQAKHDKHATGDQRRHGTKPQAMPDYAYHAAGLVHRNFSPSQQLNWHPLS